MNRTQLLFSMVAIWGIFSSIFFVFAATLPSALITNLVIPHIIIAVFSLLATVIAIIGIFDDKKSIANENKEAKP